MSQSFDSHTAKFLAAVLQSMPKEMSGDVMQGWIQNPKALQKALLDALCPPLLRPKFEVWRTIKIGTGIKSGTCFCSELEKDGFKIGDWARYMLAQEAFTVSLEEIEIDLVNLSVADLGFKDGARYDVICTRAIELGLELCSAEVCPQLRLQYPDQPHGEWLLIAMEAIRGSDGSPHAFRVGRDDGGQWLSNCCGRPGRFWRAGGRFVFRFRKQPLAA